MSTDKPDLGPDDNPMPVWMGELCERFKDAWGSDNPVSVESIVERVPADKRSIALQTLVEAEYVLRSATNDGLTAKELVRRFPNDADLVLNIHRRLAGYSSPSNRETIAPKNAPSNNDVETGSKTLQIPRQLGRYRIVRKLGQGAMGSVFLAKDEQLDRQVALKFPRGNLQQDGEQQARFLQEARSAAALHHANICPIYDAGEIQGINYICMGYVDGAPLSQFAVQDSGLTEQQIARIILQIAKAVAAAHGAGFIHRDLKPANIMIDLNNEPIILDFGLARRINRKEDQRVTQAGAIMGSPCYMSPEQIDGDEQRIGPQSDVYSLGVILYEMLTGRVPFEGSFASVMGQIMTKIPDKPSSFRKNLSVRLESICTKMMAKQQDQRFPSMAAAAEALQEYLDKFDGLDSATADGNTNETAPTNKGEQRKQHIEQLIKASDYGPAETLLVSLSRETSDALQQYAVWAAAELPKLRKLREQVRAGRQDIYETATRLMKTYDYEQVVRLLSDYPYDIRTPNMQQLLERAERLSNDVERLSKGIAAARTRGDNDSLMRFLQEKLKLKPHDREAKELYDQLFRRSEGPISKVLGGNTPRSVRSIPAAIQWLLIFALVVPMCAVPAYMWAQGYLAEKSEKSELPIAFDQQKILNADEANAPEPPKPDENQPPVPPVNDAEPGVIQQPESSTLVENDSQPAQAPSPAKSKSPLFTEADREALLSVGCKPQEATGDSNFIAVENAKITPAVADAIRHMELLRGISLQKSRFDSELLARIGYRPDFVQLWLWDSNLDAKGFVTVCSNFPNLNFISIQGVKPPSIDIFRNIQKLDKLTSLGAGWSGINHDDLEVIVKLPKLETLHLQGTKIVDRELLILSKCKTLKTLIVSKDNFKVSATNLAKFNQALPDCKIDIR